MDKHGDDSFNSAEETDLEKGESSQKSPPTKEDDPKIESEIFRTNKESISKEKSIFEAWANTLLMVPLTIITDVLAASWVVNGSGSFTGISFHHRFFLVLVMVDLYTSIAGIILWHTSPVVARVFLFASFWCSLLALTILFDAILPSELNAVPWILMGIVVLVASLLLVRETFPERK